jgi:hypothetical protein
MNIMFQNVYSPEDDVPGAARRVETAVRELEDRVARLSLICCAMWTILQAHAEVGDDELLRIVQELDLSDGIIDGKASVERVRQCTACGRPVSTRHLHCLYCGAPRQGRDPFDQVL